MVAMSPDLPRIAVDLALACALLAISAIDLRERRIPDLLSLPLLVSGLVWSAWAGDRPWTAHALGAVAGYGTLAIFGALYFRWRGREGLGLGDAKLFAAAGAWLGWRALPMVLLIASLCGLLFALLTGRVRPDRKLPFGPPLALGFWLTWIFAG
jgi:leader peptidase (prepilin peptidase)/N-methyltransferase